MWPVGMETLCNLKAVVWLFCGHILKAAAVSQTESSAHFTSQHQQLSWSCQKKQNSIYDHSRLIGSHFTSTFASYFRSYSWTLQTSKLDLCNRWMQMVLPHSFTRRRVGCFPSGDDAAGWSSKDASLVTASSLSLRWSWVRVLEML